MKIGRYLVGLISGLTFGMLFAPKEGKKLRQELVKKGGESGEEALMALYNAFKEAGTDAYGEMKKLSNNEQLQSALSMSKEKMRDYLTDLESGGYDIAERIQGHAEEITEAVGKAAVDFKKKVLSEKKVVKRAVKKRSKKVAKAAKPALKAIKKTVASKKRKVSAKKK